LQQSVYLQNIPSLVIFDGYESSLAEILYHFPKPGASDQYTEPILQVGSKERKILPEIRTRIQKL